MRFTPGEERAQRRHRAHRRPRQSAARRALSGRDRRAAPRRRADPRREHAVRPRRVPGRHARRRCSSAPASTTSACRRSCRRWSTGRRRRSRATAACAMVQPAEPPFSGFVFKIQANMDPRHRDRIAFFRVCSGRYHARHEGAAPAHRARDEARQRADLHGQRARGERGCGRRRHHRHPQPRPAADRRHADRRRGARLQGHSVFRAGALPRRAAARSVQGQAAAEGLAGARRGRRDPGVRDGASATRCCWARSASCSSRSSPTAWRSEYKVDAIYDTASISTARWLTFPDDDDATQTSSASARRQLATDVDGNPVLPRAATRYNLQVDDGALAEGRLPRDARARRAAGARTGLNAGGAGRVLSAPPRDVRAPRLRDSTALRQQRFGNSASGGRASQQRFATRFATPLRQQRFSRASAAELRSSVRGLRPGSARGDGAAVLRPCGTPVQTHCPSRRDWRCLARRCRRRCHARAW